ncbi:hypothetical protein [Nonomuraea phyllanthi]|uniref:hypothetical protein n=1 Tax=Nonomuraea phyllanthi TaxID=2219224 RepID=UPI001D15B8BF|nr:hypothetical protein [Nonomuraea phyllanthi]
MLPWSADLAGRPDHHVMDSHALRGTPLDDDIRRYPTVYVMQGYTSHITMWNNRTAFRRPFPELADQGFAPATRPRDHPELPRNRAVPHLPVR